MRQVLYILGQLTDRDAEWLARVGRQEKLAPETVLIQEGRATEALYVVLEGRLGVFRGAEGQFLARMGAGEIAGEMSFVDASPPSATVKALVESLVLAIPVATLAERLASDDGFAARFYRALAILLSDRLRSAISRGARTTLQRDDGVLEEDELDPNVLDTVSLAGSRFERMLNQLRGR